MITVTTFASEGADGRRCYVDADSFLFGRDRLVCLKNGGVVYEAAVIGVVQVELDTSAPQKAKSYSVAEVRDHHPQAYRAWSAEEEALLIKLHDAQVSEDQIASVLGRKPGAIRSRLAKLVP